MEYVLDDLPFLLSSVKKTKTKKTTRLEQGLYLILVGLHDKTKWTIIHENRLSTLGMFEGSATGNFGGL